jgi:hypothetical protein
MADVSLAIQPKSDQLNYDDVSAGKELVITINQVNVTNSDQPVSIFYNGCGEKAYKPSKGMTRLISDVWGVETDNWIGKSIALYGDSAVKWAGQEIGGIRIKAFSHIQPAGVSLFVTVSRGRRRKMHIEYMDSPDQPVTEQDQVWIDAVKADKTVLDQITNATYKARIQELATA